MSEREPERVTEGDERQNSRLLDFFANLVSHGLGSAVVSVCAAAVGFLGHRWDSFSLLEFLGAGVAVVAAALGYMAGQRRRLNSDVVLIRAALAVSKLRRDRASSDTELAISFTFLKRVKQSTLGVKAALLGCAAFAFVASARVDEAHLADAGILCLAVVALIFLREAVLEYRVRNGIFGTTRAEARELIDFIVSNAKDIDFTDGSGGIRRALFPGTQKSGVPGDSRSGAHA